MRETEKITFVQEIARQTGLLAFNAAAEIIAVSSETVAAARSGASARQARGRHQEDGRACRGDLSRLPSRTSANRVNQAIQQFDKVIQQNAAAAEEMSATSEALSGQAGQLQASIAFFRIGGKAAPAPASRASPAIANERKQPKAQPVASLLAAVH